MTKTGASKRLVLAANIVFIGLPVLETLAYGLAWVGLGFGLIFVNRYLLSLITNPLFQALIVITAAFDIAIIGKLLAGKGRSNGQKISLAALAIALLWLVLWPIVAQYSATAASWLNGIIGQF